MSLTADAFTAMLQNIADDPHNYHVTRAEHHYIQRWLAHETHAMVIGAPRRSGKSHFVNEIVARLYTEWSSDADRCDFRVVVYWHGDQRAPRPRASVRQQGEHTFTVVVFGVTLGACMITDADVFLIDEFITMPFRVRNDLACALRHMHRPVLAIGTPAHIDDIHGIRLSTSVTFYNRYGLFVHESLDAWVDRTMPLLVEE